MSSRVLVAVAACAAFVSVPATGSSAGVTAGQAVDPGAAQVTLTECTRGKRPVDRAASYVGQMDRIDGAERMRMRFTLAERIGSSKRWRGLSVPELRSWRVADPGVQRFIYRQHVDGLKVGTAYRMNVVFQWLDAEGELVLRAHRDSAICRQPGKLPNLAFRDDLEARPGPTPDTQRYVARLQNDGRVASPPTQIELRVNGAQVDVRRIGRLQPGERRTVRFVGPRCLTGVEGRLDPKGAIREIAERDNVVSAPCSQVVLP